MKIGTAISLAIVMIFWGMAYSIYQAFKSTLNFSNPYNSFQVFGFGLLVVCAIIFSFLPFISIRQTDLD